jgi:hypothetical protein
MDVIASRALECSDVKASGTGGDACQHCCRLALWAWWPVNLDHVSSLVEAGAPQNFLSPVDADGGR